MIKVIITLFIALFYVGCSSTNQSNITYEKYKPQKKVLKNTQQKAAIVPKQITSNSGAIKGEVTKLYYANGLWNYEVKGKDTSNQKLPYAKFTHKKKIAKQGSYVYAIIKNGKLDELFLLEKANFKQKKPKKRQQKNKKRTKRRQILSVPTTQSISL